MKKVLISIMAVFTVISMLVTMSAAATTNGFELISGDGTLTAVTNGFALKTTDQESSFVIAKTAVRIDKAITFDVKIADMFGTKWPNADTPDYPVVQQILFTLSDASVGPFNDNADSNSFVIAIAPHAQEGFDRVLIDFRQNLAGMDFADYGGLGNSYPQFNDTQYKANATFSVSLDFTQQNWDVFRIDGNICSAYPTYDAFRTLFAGKDLYISFGTTKLPEGSTKDSTITITNVKYGDTLISVASDDDGDNGDNGGTTPVATPTTPPTTTTPGDSSGFALYFALIAIAVVSVAAISVRKRISVK